MSLIVCRKYYRIFRVICAPAYFTNAILLKENSGKHKDLHNLFSLHKRYNLS